MKIPTNFWNETHIFGINGRFIRLATGSSQVNDVSRNRSNNSRSSLHFGRVTGEFPRDEPT
jgi:hypothetical protein